MIAYAIVNVYVIAYIIICDCVHVNVYVIAYVTTDCVCDCVSNLPEDVTMIWPPFCSR